MTELALHMRAGSVSALAELGQTERALAETGSVADRLQATGDIFHFSARALQLRLLAERGTHQQAPNTDELVTAARNIDSSVETLVAFAAAARLLLAQGRPEQARALLQELDGLATATTRASLIPDLPFVLRMVLVLDDPALAQRLVTGIDTAVPLREHALASARA